MSLKEQFKLIALIVGWMLTLPFVKLAEAVSDVGKALRDEWRDIRKGRAVQANNLKVIVTPIERVYEGNHFTMQPIPEKAKPATVLQFMQAINEDNMASAVVLYDGGTFGDVPLDWLRLQDVPGAGKEFVK